MSCCLEDLKQGASDYDSGNDDGIPEYFDRQKFDRGRMFIQNHALSCLLAMKFSLVCGLSVSNLLDVLVATGKSSTPRDSIRRYLRTAFHVVKWHYGDIWNRHTLAGKSIRAVRQIHNGAREFMIDLTKENGKHNDKVWISQYDMSLVQCGFMGALIMYPDKFGIRCSIKDLDDYVYFWRWVGYLLGIKDRNNICYGGYVTAYNICKEIEQNILIPAMKDPPEHFLPMAKAFKDGEKLLFKVSPFSVRGMMSFSLEAMGEKYSQPMELSDMIGRMFFRGLVNSLYYIPGFSWCISRICAFIFGWSKIS